MLILFFQNTKKFSLFHKKGTESSSETLKEHSLPICLTECLIGTDIAFLLDGSGSVKSQDFQKMKTFVKNLVGSFLSSDTKVRNCTAILSQTQTLQVHVAFLNFHKNMFFFLCFPLISTFHLFLCACFFFSFLFPSSLIHQRSITTLIIFSHLDHGNLTLIELHNYVEELTQLRPSNMLCKCCQDFACLLCDLFIQNTDVTFFKRVQCLWMSIQLMEQVKYQI